MRYLLYLLIGTSLLLGSCDKDPVTSETTTVITTLSGEEVIASFRGFVVDDTGEVVQGATVQIGNRTTVTTEDGLWQIEDATVVADQAFVQLISPDHFECNRTVLVRAGQAYDIPLQPLRRGLATQLPASDGGRVDVPGSDATIDLPGDGFVDAAGQPYRGQVSVYSKFLDPNEAATYRQMPGDLRGIDSLGNLALLATYGMLAVELRSSANEPLQLADGATATLRLPLSGAAAQSAPEQIPLWFFDTPTATWREEGVATRASGFYVGEVAHFTFWNCDVDLPTIKLCGGVDTSDLRVAGIDPANVTVRILSTTVGRGEGILDALGEFCGLVPANDALRLEVYEETPGCSQLLYEENIGAFSEETTLPAVRLTNFSNPRARVRLTGEVQCGGQASSNAAIIVKQAGRTLKSVYVDSDGSFDVTLIDCDQSDLEVFAVDYQVRQRSAAINVAATSMADLGTIDVCAQVLQGFFRLRLDTLDFYVDGAMRDDSKDYLRIEARDTAADVSLVLFHRDVSTTPSIGPVLMSFPDAFIGTFTLSTGDNDYQLNLTRAVNMRITRADNQAGGLIEGIVTPTQVSYYERRTGAILSGEMELEFSASW